MQKFKSSSSAQKFLNVHSATYNNFYFQRHIINSTTVKQYRAEAFDVWEGATSAA